MTNRAAILALIAFSTTRAFASSVTLEAESGARGADFALRTNAPVIYITITSNLATNYPGSAARVVSFNVTFPAAGSYSLYARVRVGVGAFNDDSMFYANGFGSKNSTASSDWIFVNGLANVGYTASSDVVTGGGSAWTNLWKWINLSQFAPGPTFTVSAGGLNQTFQIGAREDGLDMDKFVFGTAGYTFTVADLDSGGLGTPPTPFVLALPPDQVSGNLLQFNDNGAWTWYCDERSVIDKARTNLLIGSDACSAGVGGSPRQGDVEAVIYNLPTGAWQRFSLKDGASDPSAFYADDHNTPGLLVRPDGKYLAWYCGHNTETKSYWRNYDGSTWTAEQVFDWTTLPTGTDFNATYSNPHYLSAEDRAYNFVRANDHGSPNILISADHGDTWGFGGQLMKPITNINIGYVSGYFKYCDNGIDRIDFAGTETHPRDSSTSMYHGYIKNGQSFQSDGTLVDGNIFDQSPPVITQFTKIFTNGAVWPPGQTNYRCWNDDVQSYPDGTVQAIISTRINNDIGSSTAADATINPNHAFFFCRYDGTRWSDTYLCQAGYKLYPDEADYVGLGCLSPNDPNTIFISTAFDPRAVQPGVQDTNLPYANFREIWKGITTNHGATFTWTPITRNSTHDNVRPIAPPWDPNNTALLWFRVTYTSAQTFDATPVGLVDRHAETPVQLAYVDATTNNTTLATGTALVPGAGTGQWHLRSGDFNGGSLLASADVIGEDAPALNTTTIVPEPGLYDVWVNFWGAAATNADWRIMAGLTTNQMMTYRQMACKTVQPGDHSSTLVLTNNATNFLYQAYVGRASASTSNTISVFIDDAAIATGTTGPLAGNNVRTWYEGLSYAKVTPLQIIGIARNASANSTILTWLSTPQISSLSTPSYSIQTKTNLLQANWAIVANGLPSAGSTTSWTNSGLAAASAFYRITAP